MEEFDCTKEGKSNAFTYIGLPRTTRLKYLPIHVVMKCGIYKQQPLVLVHSIKQAIGFFIKRIHFHVVIFFTQMGEF